ncbi:uncharacterized protein V1510DRAFT_413881 [Dipodascopsis tothii]|uniref:uncharacterized protein n=1 Tax=Dipodascopsis tothii TaxID=44089 RepID=UPI0034CD15D4
MFWQSNKFNVEKKLVLVSGASQGLGYALAKEIFAAGADVVIVARRESKLKEAVAEIETVRVNADQKLSYATADLAVAASAQRVIDDLGRAPDVLLCCAGSSIPKLFLDVTTEELDAGIDINYKTALYLAHAGMKAMAAAKKPEHDRHIIFFSSVVHFYSLIGYSQYSPLKSALRSLADCLRQECIPYDIKVVVVFPGNFQSEGYEIEETTKPEITKKIEGSSVAIPSDECARIILKGLRAGNQMITTDFIGMVLYSAMLSGSPRSSYLVQTFFGILIAIVGPLWSLIVNRDIKTFYDKKAAAPIEAEPAAEADTDGVEPVKTAE